MKLALGLALLAVDRLLWRPVRKPLVEVTFEGPDELGFITFMVNGELVAWEQRREWAACPELLPV